MHDGGDSRECGTLEAEDAAQGFEGASLALMAELDAEHVERDGGVGYILAIGGEGESRPGIDEAADQPCRRHPIHAGARPSDPQPAGVLVAIDSTRTRTLLPLRGLLG